MNKTITVYTTSESYTYEAKAKIEEALSIMNYYKNNLPNYNYNLPNIIFKLRQNYLKIADNEKQKQYNFTSIHTGSY